MNKNDTIVLIHGLWEFPINLCFLGFHLKKSGYKVEYFKYHSVSSSISENSDKLFKFLKQLNVERVHLAGHSLGGLIALNLLDKYSVENVQYSVIFGSPVNGSVVTREMGKNTIGRKMFGKNYALLCHGLGDLPGSLCDHKVGVIAGTGGKGLGQFFADLPKPHDGSVSVQETKLTGALDRILLPTSHFSMLLSKQVALEIAEFCRKGKFISKV